jgi:uncharacterized protein
MKLNLKMVLSLLVFLIIMIPLSVYATEINGNLSQNSTNSTVMDNNLSQNNTKILNVPNVRQPSNYSSGPTSLQAVLAYYGMDTGLDKLINMTNCTPNNGTLPQNIANAAKNLGFNAEVKQNMSLVDLQQYINQGTPVIVDAQAWKNNNTTQNWADDQNDTHYMVVIGLDNENVYLEDPAVLGSRGYIPNQEFLDRWHDTYQDPNAGTNITTSHLGIIITAKEPATLPLFIKVN